ncbi:uncharacterized protein LOC122317788 [Carya illinoinensis]|uniref:uncharacterized protein LOC122317788 n=1 Tax=Carya illinoinensis TaxID=32201 RepID=UPI001C718022|nr:uncharacterized protein LOC122317788 [Carya illinoinensis]
MNINHLFFADDNLLFYKANPLEWNRLIHLLEVYENASGQRLNKDKNSIYFSKNTNQEVKGIIVQIAEAKVAELIDQDTKAWNVQLIKDIFSEEEAASIQKIPISIYNSPDRIIWRGTNNGLFMIRSAYHMQNDIQQRNKGQSSCEKVKEQWGKLWSLAMPNTEILFMWKACNNNLPTKQNLFRKRIVEELDCPICLHEVESIEHDIWECESLRDVWGLCSMKVQKRSLQNQSFRELVFDLLEEMDDEILIEMVVMAWRLWKRRNEVVFQKEYTNPLIILNQTRQKLQDLRLLQSNTSVSTTRQVNCAEPMNQWKAPPNRHYEVNWDATIDQKKCTLWKMKKRTEGEGREL